MTEWKFVIIGCGQNKRVTSGPIPARDLYVSTYFDLKRQYAEQADKGAILSAKFGVVPLSFGIETYDMTMDDVQSGLDGWVAKVMMNVGHQAAHLGSPVEIEVLAGSDYVEPLREAFKQTPWTVRYPFDDTAGIGEQMAWLKDRVESQQDDQENLVTDGGVAEDSVVEHLYCKSCESNPSYALIDGRGRLVCHCTHADGEYNPYPIHGFGDRPAPWEFRQEGSA